jgi:hypothetical protein
MTNERNDALLQAQFRAVQAAASHYESHDRSNPVSQVLTSLMRHGGVYSLADGQMMAARMAPLMMAARSTGTNNLVSEKQLTPKDVESFVSTVSSRAVSFFQHMVARADGKDLSYAIPSPLMTHLTSPATGQVFKDATGGPESPEIPAAFTFVGQFVDHDLTMNAVNLFEDQAGPVQDTASPLIDLDSVYGPRKFLSSPSTDIYNSDGTFKLKPMGGYFDLLRDTQNSAFISDKRNDENQLILQVHILVMRVHNKLIKDEGLSLKAAYEETVFNWQSVLLHDYLTRILDSDVYDFLRGEIEKKDFGDFKYKPLLNLTNGKFVASMPHEFAIGFRFGHSQLRSRYVLKAGGTPIRLFDNTLTSANDQFEDLRGSQVLAAGHVVDWDHFAGTLKSNRIDSKLTPVVADLPESTIPDDIKYIGNLAHRNLIRSRQVGLCSGEDLAEFYGFPRHHVPKDFVEPDPGKRHLYEQTGQFLTPLWYYLLKEAEQAGTAQNSRLGKVGSRLVGEVILGAIKWGDHSVLNKPTWKSKITGTSTVKLLDLAHFVN